MTTIKLTEADNEKFIGAISLRMEAGLGLSWQELSNLKKSSMFSNIEILSNANNTKLGYVAWASVNKETALQLLQYGLFPHYPYEWSEGNICLIVDVLFIPGKQHEAKKSLLKFLTKKRVIAFQRRNKASLLIKQIGKYKKHIKTFPKPGNIEKNSEHH